MLFLFFFFKQKTAYEMRISDWSSDVCSSDLEAAQDRRRGRCGGVDSAARSRPARRRHRRLVGFGIHLPGAGRRPARPRDRPEGRRQGRSEEHTSELQSLMRISYAVFCLKKKKRDKYITTDNTTNTQTPERP